MLPFRFASTLVCFLTLGFVAVGTPVVDVRRASAGALETRQVPDIIVPALTVLESALTAPLAAITDMTASNNVSEEAVTPQLALIKAALDTAALTLDPLGGLALAKRQADDDTEVAELVAKLLTDITTALAGLTGSLEVIPALGGLLAGIDTSLNQVLKGLEILLAGVLTLVANLLTNVAALLRQLAFGLTLASLGL